MKHRTSAIWLVVLMTVQYILQANSATRHVPQDYASIQSAINAAAAGDTVFVSEGRYLENINFLGKPIVVRGIAPDLVTIDGGQATNPDSASTVTFVSQEDSTAVLESFTITGGAGTLTNVGTRGGGVFCAHARPTIRNCIITGNRSESGGGIGIWHADYQYINGTVVHGCVLYDNGGIGIWPGYATATIWNCTLYGDGILLSSFGWGTTVTNTVIWNAAISGAMAPNSVNYSDVEGGWTDGVGNIDQNPIFCNPAAGDFHLASTSPCLQAGELGSDIGALGAGCVVDVQPECPPRPTDFALGNYPNPFNPFTIVRYNLPDRSHVTVTVFTTLGRRICSLVEDEQDAGYHEVRFDATGLASGVYVYRLQAGETLISRTMTLIR